MTLPTKKGSPQSIAGLFVGEGAPWAQRPDEPARAYAIFLKYLQLPVRSLKALVKTMGKKHVPDGLAHDPLGLGDEAAAHAFFEPADVALRTPVYDAPHGEPSIVTSSACGPFGLAPRVNETRCPSYRPRRPSIWIAEWCTKTSFPPSSGVMNP